MCQYPRTLASGHVVKCGKCYECIKQYQDTWMIRLAEESVSWKHVFFLTLTYDQEHLPTIRFADLLDLDPLSRHDLRHFHSNFSRNIVKGPSYWKRVNDPDRAYDYLRSESLGPDTLVPHVRYDDVRSWLKVARMKYSRDFKCNMNFKYFLCSEYGPQTLRPHYHVVIFCNEWTSRNRYRSKDGGFTNFIQRYFIDTWRFGNVKWRHKPIEGSRGANGQITSVTKYVAKYCCKPQFAKNPYLRLGLNPEFRLCSNGISSAYRDQFVHDVREIVKKYKFYGKYHSPSGFYGYNPEMLREIHNRCFISITTKSGDILSYRLPRYVLDSLFPRAYVDTVYRDPLSQEVYKKKRSYYISVDPLQDAIKAYTSVVFSHNSMRDILQCTGEIHERLGVPPDDPVALSLASSELLVRRGQKAYATLFKYYRDKGYLSTY